MNLDKIEQYSQPNQMDFQQLNNQKFEKYDLIQNKLHQTINKMFNNRTYKNIQNYEQDKSKHLHAIQILLKIFNNHILNILLNFYLSV